MPHSIIATAIIWNVVIRSCKNIAARNIPNTDESDSIKTVTVVPILLKLCKTKYRDTAKPNIPSSSIYEFDNPYYDWNQLSLVPYGVV